MISSCVLLTPISPSYLRNNRSTGQKSFRCFPTCSPSGHVVGGFCGQSLRIQMTLQSEAKNADIEVGDFIFIAEIRPSDEPRVSAMEFVKKSTLMAQVRTKQEKEIGVKELFLGEVHVLGRKRGEMEVEVEFNGRRHSWDYSWKSNRWNEQQHVVDIIVLTFATSQEYRVTSSFCSSQFMVLSSHKKAVKKRTHDRTLVVIAEEEEDFRDGGLESSEKAEQDLLTASAALSSIKAALLFQPLQILHHQQPPAAAHAHTVEHQQRLLGTMNHQMTDRLILLPPAPSVFESADTPWEIALRNSAAAAPPTNGRTHARRGDHPAAIRASRLQQQQQQTQQQQMQMQMQMQHDSAERDLLQLRLPWESNNNSGQAEDIVQLPLVSHAAAAPKFIDMEDDGEEEFVALNRPDTQTAQVVRQSSIGASRDCIALPGKSMVMQPHRSGGGFEMMPPSKRVRLSAPQTVPSEDSDSGDD